jgi:hypothetical protein
MLGDNFKFVESALVAEDIFNDPELSMHSKCVSVERTVGKGILSLEKALEIYEVPPTAYFGYLAVNEAKRIDISVTSESQKGQVISMISVFQAMFLQAFTPILAIAEITKIVSKLNGLSKNIKEDKVALKEKVVVK